MPGRVTTGTERLVFVSHAGDDTWIAKQIARGITEAGARPFLDEADVDVGAEFEEDIREFLEQAHELVVLITPQSLTRPYVWAEIGAAWIRRIPIVAVLHGVSPAEFQMVPGAPIFVKKRSPIRLNDIDVYFEQLARRVTTETNDG